jgi:amidohydrolase
MARSTEPLLDALLAGIERELPKAVALRRRLHAAPELAHAEERTAASVAAELPFAAEVVAGTGLLAQVDPGASREGARAGAAPVAVRAELDGLPLRERTGSPFAASGDVMHACGHDVHMAALVALTRAAYALADELPAPLLAIFQPSEEAYPSGAQQLADEQLGALAPAAIVAAHIHPELRWGSVALDPGAVNASCDGFTITVEGAPSHGAYPHQGRDPILAIAQVVVALHAQLGRRIDPLSAASLTIGVLEAGTAENLIPAQAQARGALRAHRPQDRLALRELVVETAAAIAAAHGCEASVELEPGEPALENDPRIVARARQLLAHAGFTPAPEWRSCGSDDFAFFGALAPLAMAFVGLDGAAGFAPRPLHHPELLPPDEAVGAVARVQALLYVAAARAATAADGREAAESTQTNDRVRGAVMDRSAPDHPTRRPDR